MSAARTILLLGTLDTKGAEYAFVRDLIQARGHQVVLMDLGVLASDPVCPVEIPAAAVAEAGGGNLAELQARRDRGAAVAVMQAGAMALVRSLHLAGGFEAILGLGGGGGTTMITAAMRTLPVGVPKVMVSTMASGNTAPYVDIKDVTMMYSVVDIAGINPLSRRILANAVGAVCGMAEQPLQPGRGRPLLGASMFGVTTPCVTAARERLEAAGYDVAVFHATGSGGRALESLCDDGYLAGVLDVTTTEWADEVVGGTLSAGPDRLRAAGRRGIPQVVSVGALDMVNFGPADTVPPRFADRTFYHHNATVTLMRTTAEECGRIGQRIAEQLNQARGPVTVVLPLRGISMIDQEGQPFHDPAADQALFAALQEHLAPTIPCQCLDLHINDPAFAHALADTLLSSLR